jgi:hypothetical protein
MKNTAQRTRSNKVAALPGFTFSADPRTLFFLVAWAVLLAGGRSRLLQDPGTFWHILVGDRIFESGLPRHDWLSFTFGGQAWIAQQWGAECAMSLLYRLGGFDALLVATTAALALLLAWLFHRLLIAGVTALWAVFVVTLSFLASSHHFHIRPHVLSILFFAWMYARLIDFEAGRIGLGRLTWLIPLWFGWVNCHGAILGGLGTFGLAAAGWTVARLFRAPSPVPNARAAGFLVLVLVAGLAAIFLNPYGLEMPRAWNAIVQSRELPRAIVEHASLARTRSWQVLILASLFVAAFVGVGVRPEKVTSALPIVWLILAFGRVRHAPLFAVAATLALAELLPRARWASRLSERGIHILAHARHCNSRRFPRAPLASAAGAVTAVMLFHLVATARGPLIAELDPRQWPVDLVPALRSAAADLPVGSPILNDLRLGGFIAFHEPHLRISVDDRWELYGDVFMRDFIRGDGDWFEQLAVRYGVTLAVAEPGSQLDEYLQRRRWIQVATSPAGRLYRRLAPLRASIQH